MFIEMNFDLMKKVCAAFIELENSDTNIDQEVPYKQI